MNLKEAIGAVTEMFEEVRDISHPYTTAHARELNRRIHSIVASFSGEDRTRIDAVVNVGWSAVAHVVDRNSKDTIEAIGGMFVTVAADAPMSGAERWEERMESLEYSLAGFGIEGERVGDDSVKVQPLHVRPNPATVTAKSADPHTYSFGLTPKDVIHKHLPVRFAAKFTRDDIAAIEEACGDNVAFVSKGIPANTNTNILRADMELLLQYLAESDNEDANSLRTSILSVIGIEEV